MSFRFIHAADLHLGSPFKGLRKIPSILRDQIVTSASQAFLRMVEWAVKENIDFVLLSGDIFDTSYRSIQAQLQFKKEMDRLRQAGIPCYIIHGNHDPLDGDFHQLHLPEHVVVFPPHQVGMEVFEKDGRELAHIYGISYDTAKVSRNLVPLFNRRSPDVFSIGMLHTNCDGAQEHENYAPSSRQDLLQSGFDYWALGHVHQSRILHKHPFIVYPGNLQGRHIREQGAKGFFVVEVEQKQVIDIRFQPVHQLMWLEREVDLTDVETIDEFLQLLEKEKETIYQEYQRESLIVRLKGIGSTSLASQLMDTALTQNLIDSIQDMSYLDSEKSTVWIESFRFDGTPTYNREELLHGSGLFQDILEQADRMLVLQDGDAAGGDWQEITRELLDHYRVRQVLEAFTLEEQRDIIRQAESLLLSEWTGGRSS